VRSQQDTGPIPPQLRALQQHRERGVLPPAIHWTQIGSASTHRAPPRSQYASMSETTRRLGTCLFFAENRLRRSRISAQAGCANAKQVWGAVPHHELEGVLGATEQARLALMAPQFIEQQVPRNLASRIAIAGAAALRIGRAEVAMSARFDSLRARGISVHHSAKRIGLAWIKYKIETLAVGRHGAGGGRGSLARRICTSYNTRTITGAVLACKGRELGRRAVDGRWLAAVKRGPWPVDARLKRVVVDLRTGTPPTIRLCPSLESRRLLAQIDPVTIQATEFAASNCKSQSHRRIPYPSCRAYRHRRRVGGRRHGVVLLGASLP